MCVTNLNDTLKNIVNLNISLTFKSPYFFDIVSLHMSLTTCENPNYTESVSVHISLRYYPPYLTAILNLLISLTVYTLIYPLLS